MVDAPGDDQGVGVAAAAGAAAAAAVAATQGAAAPAKKGGKKKPPVIYECPLCDDKRLINELHRFKVHISGKHNLAWAEEEYERCRKAVETEEGDQPREAVVPKAAPPVLTPEQQLEQEKKNVKSWKHLWHLISAQWWRELLVSVFFFLRGNVIKAWSWQALRVLVIYAAVLVLHWVLILFLNIFCGSRFKSTFLCVLVRFLDSVCAAFLRLVKQGMSTAIEALGEDYVIQ